MNIQNNYKTAYDDAEQESENSSSRNTAEYNAYDMYTMTKRYPMQRIIT